MLFDIKDILIKEIYIPHLEYLRDTYVIDNEKFCAGIDLKCKPYLEILEGRKQEHNGDEDYCVCDERECQIVSDYADLKYHYLSSVLQSIVALWENQLQDFYLTENYKDYNEIKKRLKEYYDLDTDSEIYEIRQVYNYLKHGANGNAERNLIKIKSHYYRNDGYDGEVRCNYYRAKQLNLAETDITLFANAFIRFWSAVYEKIEQIDEG